MPDDFLFVREMWSFWATESVWNGEVLFSKVEQRPSFFGEGRALLFMPGIDLIGSSTHSLCLPWSYCNFKVYDCNNKLVYQGVAF